MVDYRHHGAGVLRASAAVVAPSWWPDLADDQDCRTWLGEVWPGIAAAVGHASPVLAARVDVIFDGADVSERDVSRSTLAVVRYVQRFGRSMPFGLFAGVGAATVGESAAVRFGGEHRPVVRADARWLRAVVERLETCPGLLTQLDVVFTDAAHESGGRWRLRGAEAVSIRATAAVELVRATAASGVWFVTLAAALREAFPHAGDPVQLLVSLLDKGFLVSSVRAPSTVVDPLGFVVDRLRKLDTNSLPVAGLVRELAEIHRDIATHNDDPSDAGRAALAARLRAVVDSVRVPLSVDLRLDADVTVPGAVVREMERAAGVLARLVREHTGSRAWRDWFAAFCDRYGTGTLVPLRTVVDPVSGLGFPRGYPDSPEPSARHVFSDRDRLLFALAAEATTRGAREIELTAATVDALAAAGGAPETVPPHIDMGARIHATSPEALERGEYTFTAAPGRAAGTLSSRFSPLVPELSDALATLPTTVAGALPAQLSFTPMYPSAENVARVPAYLPDVVTVGEHHDGEGIGVDDLALTATRQRLHLVSLSRGRVVEPLVLHALAPKQQPPLARFVGEVSRALDSGWVGFDWGAAEALPFRPRIRYGRAILCAARWRITRADLPADAAAWDGALADWRAAWRCPSRVELRDFDQLLPLNLDVPTHREVLYRHLRANDDAVLVEAPDPDADGWINGHAHTVVFPLVSQREQAPGPDVAALPMLGRGHGHGHVPGSVEAGWLYAKAYVPAHRMNAFLVGELPGLLAALGGRACWFVRWPQASDSDEPDHLRIRVRVDQDPDKAVAVVAEWTERLRTAGRLNRLAFDTYYPETGRYLALGEAEAVFSADSRFVLALLTHAHGGGLAAEAVAALSLFDVVAGFLGGRDQAAAWLTAQRFQATPERAHVEQITRLVRGGMWADVPGWPAIADAHRQRADTIAAYRTALPNGADADAALHALLHMHHNRALGVDREREAVCLRLARQAAATWRATRTGHA